MLHHTMFRSAIYDEVSNFVAKNTLNGIIETDSLVHKGNLSVPVNYLDYNAIHRKYSQPFSRDIFGSIDRLRNKLQGGNIVQCDVSFIDAIHMASRIVVEDTENLIYGVVYTAKNSAYGTKDRINLLHPMIAMAIIDGQYDVYKDSTGVLTIYSFSESQRVNTDRIDSILGNIRDILAIQSQNWYSVQLTNRCATSNSDLVTACFYYSNMAERYSNYVRIEASAKSPALVLTPIQLYTKAMVYPYYGIIASACFSNGSEYQSINLSPMLTGNIRQIVNSNGDDWNSTCTGDLSSKSYKSLYVMNNMNLNSLYSEKILPAYFYTVARVYMELSSNLYDEYFDFGIYSTGAVATSEEATSEEATSESTVNTQPLQVQRTYSFESFTLKPRFIDGAPVYGSVGIKSGSFVLCPDGSIRVVGSRSNTHVMMHDDKSVHELSTLIQLYR